VLDVDFMPSICHPFHLTGFFREGTKETPARGPRLFLLESFSLRIAFSDLSDFFLMNNRCSDIGKSWNLGRKILYK